MDFLAAVDAAVDAALPASWPRVAPERLGRQRDGAGRVRHAFRLRSAEAGAGAGAEAGGQRPGDYLGILTLPRHEAERPPARAVRELTIWRDQALVRGAFLLVLYEQETLDRLDELGGLVATHLDQPHSRFLALACAPGEGGAWGAAPTPSGEEPLDMILRDLWHGDLRFCGPRAGRQTVGVELMRDACWCCEQPIATVTGLAFPDREVTDWSSCDWRYYRRLLPLAEIEPRLLAVLAARVEKWLRTDCGAERVTPLSLRAGVRPAPPDRRSTWAALCPDCGALRGAFLVGADRLDLLLDTESRRIGKLSYRPWEIEVTSDLIKALAAGTELSVFACSLGWRRVPREAAASTVIETGPAGVVAGPPPGPPADAPARPSQAGPAAPSAGAPAGRPAPHSGAAVAGPPAALRLLAPTRQRRQPHRFRRAFLGVRAWMARRASRRRS